MKIMPDNRLKNRPGSKHFSGNNYRYPQKKFQVYLKLKKCSMVDIAHDKGQLISEAIFSWLQFVQKTNEIFAKATRAEVFWDFFWKLGTK